MKAGKRVEHCVEILDEIGISGERLKMYNISSSMGATFAEEMRVFTEKIKSIGPNPLKKRGDRYDHRE